MPSWMLGDLNEVLASMLSMVAFGAFSSSFTSVLPQISILLPPSEVLPPESCTRALPSSCWISSVLSAKAPISSDITCTFFDFTSFDFAPMYIFSATMVIVLPAASLSSVRFSFSTSIDFRPTALALMLTLPVALPSVSVAERSIFSARIATLLSAVRAFSLASPFSMSVSTLSMVKVFECTMMSPSEV